MTKFKKTEAENKNAFETAEKKTQTKNERVKRPFKTVIINSAKGKRQEIKKFSNKNRFLGYK